MPTQANLALRPVATSMTIARCCVWYLIAWGKSPSAWCAFPSVLWIAPTRPGSTQDPLALRETFHRRSSTTPSAWRLTRRWATGRGRAGRTGTSVARTSRCLAIAKEVGNRAGEGGAHGGLGNAHDSLGDFSKARLTLSSLRLGFRLGFRLGLRLTTRPVGDETARSSTTCSTWRLPRR